MAFGGRLNVFLDSGTYVAIFLSEMNGIIYLELKIAAFSISMGGKTFEMRERKIFYSQFSIGGRTFEIVIKDRKIF